MRKTKTVHLLMLLLLVSSYIVTLGTVRPVSSTAAKDITHLVDITGLKMKKDNGSEVTEDNKINISDTIHLEYSWEVSEANMPQVEAGDSFTVSLPDPEYFGGYSDEGPYDLENPYGENSLGTFKLEGNNFIVTINEEGASQTVLRDGWLTVDVKALKAGTEIDGGGNGSTNIPKLYIIDPGGGENPGGDDEEYPEESLPFRKDGKQNFGENSINWSFIVNYQGLQELINTYSTNKAAGTETKIVPRENSLLIDKLDPGMKFQEDSLYVTVPVQTITTSGKMGTRLVKNTNNLQVQSEFERIYPEDGESYETFMNRVRNSPATNNQRAYGVYTDSENRDTVLVAFGNLPGDHAKYNDVHTGAIANAIASDDTLNDTQKSDLQNIYCDPNESPGGGGIVAYGLSFTADVLVGEGYGNGTYANKAQFIWGDDGSEEDEWETEFQRIGGGVASDFIQAEKEVEGTGELIEPRHFEFEIVEKENPETAIAYGITSEKISQKGKRIKIDFYKQKDANGNYTEKISGNEGANGWGSVMVDGHSYLIKEVGSPEYSSMITGGTGEGDQYDYNAQINKATQFLILNQSTINLQAKKKVTGTAELTSPVTFTFHLKNQDNPVAYGKTVVDQKDKEYLIDFYTSPTFEEETRIDDWKNILSIGEQYTLEEITANGYHPTYRHRNGESGEFTPGNTITVDDESQNTLHFLVENKKEKPKAIKVSLEAKKELIGRELKDEEFDFELYDSTGQLLETKTNDGSSIAFASLTFDEVGAYTYTIKEKAGTEKGMSYDSKTVTATIMISEADNELESKITYTDDDEQENTANEFINTFSEIEPIKVSLEAHKSLIGRELKDEEFDFELYDSTGQLLETKTNNGSSIAFASLTFDKAGTYTYTIKEKVGTEKGMSYDPKTVTATIAISEADNKLESTVTYTDDDGQENTANEFINTFSEIKPIKVSLEAHKSLIGRELKDKEFDFELYDSTGQLLETKTNNGSSIAFASLTFDKAGTYTYTIKEKAGTEKGMSYDSKTVTATIVISEADNKLESTVTYTDDDGQENTANEFINTFSEIEPIKVSLEAHKSLMGRELKDEEFDFELYDSSGQLLETKTNNGTAITFSPLPFDEVGTYTYTIKEKAGDENGMSYDPKTVTAAITISKKDGQLESQITYVDDDGQENTANVFINVYNEEPPTGGFCIRKVDNETNEPLANAVFHVFDSENQRVKEDEIIKTDEDGVVRVDGLPFGDYYAVEADPPEGYQIEDEPMKVSIHEESHEERNIVTNRDPKIQTGITLTKIDSVTKKKLQGAEFELKDALNDPVDLGRKLITDENGLIHIDSLPAGEYSLVEIKAPTGYKLDSEPLKFTITKENKLVDLTKENTVELVPDKKVTPTVMPTEQKKSTPVAQTSSASTSKQYPKLNMWENVVLAILGWSVLGGLWLYLKKR